MAGVAIGEVSVDRDNFRGQDERFVESPHFAIRGAQMIERGHEQRQVPRLNLSPLQIDSHSLLGSLHCVVKTSDPLVVRAQLNQRPWVTTNFEAFLLDDCLLYTSDAADE